jgi:class 3 adenylate cyclase
LSDRDITDVSVEARLRDLEAVIGASGLERFSLFAWSQASPVAMVYAAEHLERVDKLALFASFCGGQKQDEVEKENAVLKALLDLMRAEWGIGARTTMGFVHPDADREEMEQELAFLRASSSGEIAARILEEGFTRTNVREYLPRIKAPALVMHRRDDHAVSAESGRIVASLIPNARFLLLDGDHHTPFDGNQDAVINELEDFLGAERSASLRAQPAVVDAGDAPIAILFTDMESSTELTQRLGDARAQRLVRTHNEIVRNALTVNGGREIKHTGDGIMASFTSASRGLDAAIQIQRSFAQHNQSHPETTINVRIGLNAGEPVREQDDLFGQAVQLARRICDRAEPGQILASNVVRELVAGKSFLFADQGTADLRGFEDPVRLYEVSWRD